MPGTHEKLQKTTKRNRGNIKYDIGEMRKGPKIHRWVAQRGETPEITPTENATQAWENLKTEIQQALKKNTQYNAKKRATRTRVGKTCETMERGRRMGRFQKTYKAEINSRKNHTTRQQRKKHNNKSLCAKYCMRGNKQPNT